MPQMQPYVLPKDSSLAANSFGLEQYTEREVKYLIPVDRIASLSGERFILTQSYIPRTHRQLLSELIHELGDFEFFRQDLRKLRLRESHALASGESRYLLQGKRRLPGHSNVETIELSVPISRELYDALLPYATNGSVQKQRTVVASECMPELRAELDLMTGWGSHPSDLTRLRPEFATVDIELVNASQLELLRSGREVFPFLRPAVELTDGLHEELRSAVSAKRVAKRGLNEKAHKLLEPALKQL